MVIRPSELEMNRRAAVHIFLSLASTFCLVSQLFADERVRIGALLVLSGENSVYGINAQRGMQLALEDVALEAKTNPKVPFIEVIVEDEAGGKVAKGAAAYQKLTKVDGVKIIFGPNLQDSALALAPLAERDGVLLVSPSVVKMGLPNLFTTWIDPKQEVKILAELILRTHKRVAILSSEQSWDSLVAKEFNQIFQQLGGQVVAFEELLPDTQDVSTAMLRVRAAKPDALFIPSFLLLPKYVIAARNLKLGLPMYSLELDRSIIQAAQGAAEGLIFIGPRISPGRFDDVYKKRFSATADIPAYQAYDAIRLLAKAIETVGGEVSRIEKWLNSFNSYDGVAGRYSRVEGVLELPTQLYVIKGEDYSQWDG